MLKRFIIIFFLMLCVSNISVFAGPDDPQPLTPGMSNTINQASEAVNNPGGFVSGLSNKLKDPTFATILQNFDTSLNKIFPALIALCYLLGLFFILKALYSLKKLGYKTAFMQSNSSILAPAALIMIGVILMYTPEFLKIMFLSLYGTSTVTSVIDWQAQHKSTSGGIDGWEASIVPLVGIIQAIGLFAFIRGWFLVVKSSAENAQPGNLSKGAMHIVGGVLAINITGTIDLVNQSLGL